MNISKKKFPWPKRTVAAVTLSFDDGNQLAKVLPILDSHNVKATFNIPTSLVGTGNHDSWEVIKKASEKGHEMASHTVSHVPLSVKLGTSGEMMKRELVESKKTIEQQLGVPCVSFAYPGGHYDRLSQKCVAEAGYISARASAKDRGFNDPYNLEQYALKIQSVTKQVSVSKANRWVDMALKRGAWLIEVFHTMIKGDNKYLWTKEKLESHLSYLTKKPVWIATQGEVMQYLLEKGEQREKETHEIYESEEYVKSLEKHGAGFFRYYLPEVVPPKGGKFLDVGCGVGYVVRELTKQGYEAVGVDISKSSIRKAKNLSFEEKVSSSFLVADAKKLPFQNNSFDVVGCFDLMEHLYEPEKCIKEMVRVLKSSGKIVICCPNLQRVVRVLGPFRQSICFTSLKNIFKLMNKTLKMRLSQRIRPEYNPDEKDVKVHLTNPPYLLQICKEHSIDILLFSSYGWNALTKIKRAIQKALVHIPVVKHWGDGIFILGRKIHDASSLAE